MPSKTLPTCSVILQVGAVTSGITLENQCRPKRLNHFNWMALQNHALGANSSVPVDMLNERAVPQTRLLLNGNSNILTAALSLSRAESASENELAMP